ncbi:hypothetical protein [Paenibacillus alkalitolerans]|uniref:hypothetical protein n=1 Tax=Paenibacillus alkalitolerans TaxID=2799335 RepID=UPI0018F556A4|nr:hypothetical protein [Paenibacillus alkalitolerans]
MTVYWLTPVTALSPATLGAERIKLNGEDAETFRRAMHAIHPRLLLSFKSALLLSDEEDVCGAQGDEDSLDLESEGPIVFDGGSRQLSHCAEAFLDRLPDPAEAAALVRAAEPALKIELQRPPFDCWLEAAALWWSQGYRVMLLKEE